jgi:hypothetical protein
MENKVLRKTLWLTCLWTAIGISLLNAAEKDLPLIRTKEDIIRYDNQKVRIVGTFAFYPTPNGYLGSIHFIPQLSEKLGPKHFESIRVVLPDLSCNKEKDYQGYLELRTYLDRRVEIMGKLQKEQLIESLGRGQVKETVVSPLESIEIVKPIVTLDISTDKQKYKPGQNLSYKLLIKNESRHFLNSLLKIKIVQDYLLTKVSGDKILWHEDVNIKLVPEEKVTLEKKFNLPANIPTTYEYNYSIEAEYLGELGAMTFDVED